jgi:hypothetical protein
MVGVHHKNFRLFGGSAGPKASGNRSKGRHMPGWTLTKASTCKSRAQAADLLAIAMGDAMEARPDGCAGRTYNDASQKAIHRSKSYIASTLTDARSGGQGPSRK